MGDTATLVPLALISTDKLPYLQCRCNQLSPHSTCHLKPTTSNVSTLIAKCSSLFSIFYGRKCYFLHQKIKKPKIHEFFFQLKNERQKKFF